ncbi:hypothetical protein BH10ACI2_BH10ACI2_24760 [soil metagenome]
MKFRVVSLLFVMSCTAFSVFSQSKTVTNADLEKYRQERVKAELEYRENYSKLGMPSPEELDKQRIQSRIENEQLADKLRAERLEREILEYHRYADEQRAIRAYQAAPVIESGQPFYYDSFGSFGNSYRRPVRQRYSQPGYFAGGQFLPTGPRTPPRQNVWVRLKPHR